MKYLIKASLTGLIVWLGWIVLKLVVDGNNYFGDRAPFPISQFIRDSLISLVFFVLVLELIFICSKPIIQSRWYFWVKGTCIGVVSYFIFTAAVYASEMMYCGGEGMCGLVSVWTMVIGLVLIPLGLITGLIVGLVKRKNKATL